MKFWRIFVFIISSIWSELFYERKSRGQIELRQIRRNMKPDIKKNKERFVELLRSTKREGVENLISDLEDMGFFTAPASAAHHLNTEGGLVQHSLYTYDASVAVWEGLKKLDPSIEREVAHENIVIAALLHDVCKSDIYLKTTRYKRNDLGQWESFDGYKASYKNFPMGHGEKSVVLVLCSGLEMTDAEMLAIRWHMGAWGLNFNSAEEERNFDVAKTLYPLVSIIQAGDNLAAGVLERTAAKLDEL